VAKWNSVKRMAEQAEQGLGPIDVLVNNAGSLVTIAPIWEADPEQWWHDVEGNLLGTFLCTRAVLPGMIARRHGTIINLSGGLATCPSPAISAYISSKTAVVRFTECLAAEVREYGLRAYSMGPGLVVTKLTESLMNTAAGQRWQPTVSARVAAGENVPPERSAQLALFLATDAGVELSGRLIEIYDDMADLTRRGPEIQRNDLYVLRIRK
jgi:NAD(P)-dependent dehydrogenase (short-subunit alcohol dehydrogenase family)